MAADEPVVEKSVPVVHKIRVAFPEDSVRIKRKDSFFRRLPSRIINAVVRKTTGVMMNDYGCMLRAYRRPIVDACRNTWDWLGPR